MDSGWFKLAEEYFKDKGLSMQYHIAQDWFYRRCLFSRHERQTRTSRRAKLLNMREHVEMVRTQAVEWHTEGFKILEPYDPFKRLSRHIRGIGIPGPTNLAG